MGDYAELISCYGGDTYELMRTFIERLKSDADKGSYAEALRLFNEITGSDPLHADAGIFSRYVQKLADMTSPGNASGKVWKHSTALKNRKIVSSFVRYCEKMKNEGSAKVPADFEDKLMYSPMRKVRETYRYDEVISVSDLDRLYVQVRDSGDLMLMCAVIFAFRCFLRPVNFIGASFSDIYTDASGEYFLDAKGRSAMVHIPSDCVCYIEKYDMMPHGKFIFAKTRSDEPMDITYLDGKLRRACAKAGIEGSVTLNSLRNSATVYAVSNGATPEMMAEALDMQTLAHIRKLSSLKVHFNNTEDYVGIRFVLPGKEQHE